MRLISDRIGLVMGDIDVGESCSHQSSVTEGRLSRLTWWVGTAGPTHGALVVWRGRSRGFRLDVFWMIGAAVGSFLLQYSP